MYEAIYSKCPNTFQQMISYYVTYSTFCISQDRLSLILFDHIIVFTGYTVCKDDGARGPVQTDHIYLRADWSSNKNVTTTAQVKPMLNAIKSVM